MLDALLAQWTAFYKTIMNSTSNSNSTSLQASQTEILDIESSPSTSTASAATTDGWTVTPVWSTGGDGTNDFAKHLQDILNRTVTRPILSDVAYHPLIAAIVLASTLTLWQKFRSPAGTAGVSWKDALGLALIGSCVAGKWMLEAIALTAAYVAWSFLADRQWNTADKLPDFDIFLASLRSAATTPTTSDATTKTSPSTDDNNPSSTRETTALTNLEASLGLPPRNPSSECVVCWTSDEDEPPLRLPCSHQVCKDCLTRLRETSRNTCPYCSTPLFHLPSKNTKKHLLYQISVASNAVHLAICLTEAALKLAHAEYFGALLMLSFNLPSALSTQRTHYRNKSRAEEVIFASATEVSLGIQVAVAIYMAHASYGRVPRVDWANFFDGEWQRYRSDEWAVFRGVVCWVAPGLAAGVVGCPEV